MAHGKFRPGGWDVVQGDKFIAGVKGLPHSRNGDVLTLRLQGLPAALVETIVQLWEPGATRPLGRASTLVETVLALHPDRAHLDATRIVPVQDQTRAGAGPANTIHPMTRPSPTNQPDQPATRQGSGSPFGPFTTSQFVKFLLAVFGIVAAVVVASVLTQGVVAPWLATLPAALRAILGVWVGVALAAPLWLVTKREWRRGNGWKLGAYLAFAWLYTLTPLLEGGSRRGGRGIDTYASQKAHELYWEQADWYLVAWMVTFHVTLYLGWRIWKQQYRTRKQNEKES